MNIVWQELHLATEGPSKEQTDDYGRQCLACQKRGIRCDATPVSCIRCRSDDLDCPGYSKALNKIHLRSSKSHHDGDSKLKSSRSPSASLKIVVPSTTQATKDWVILLESIKYWNSNVVPYSKPAHLPYRRQNIETKYWDLMPEILRNLWILTVGGLKASRSDTDPLSNSDLVRYRGRSLNELQKLMKDVPGAVEDPFGVALYSILFLFGFEMQASGSQWASHLEAARRIIGLKGGLVKCFAAFPPITHGPLTSSMMADTITATTCPARLLSTAFVQTQQEWLEVLPDKEQDLIASAYSYPLPLLLAIVQTNMLRAQVHSNQCGDGDSTPLDIDRYTVLQSIQEFDAERWAARVSAFGRARPETSDSAIPIRGMICLASLAHCYKSAAMLYLVLSTSRSIDPQLRQVVHAARHTLSQHLTLLFEQGHKRADPGCDGPLHTQLWKFVAWPLFVSVYVRAAWGQMVSAFDRGKCFPTGTDSSDAMERDMKHLRAISAAMGSRKLLHVEKLVQGVQQARTMLPEKGIEATWMWEDGFSERSIFVV